MPPYDATTADILLILVQSNPLGGSQHEPDLYGAQTAAAEPNETLSQISRTPEHGSNCDQGVSGSFNLLPAGCIRQPLV